jgi:putative modified peptide
MNPIGHTPLSDAVADRLLDLLSSDDEYRALFAADPRKALADIGYVLAEEEHVACLDFEELASKEEFQQSRAMLKQYLTSVAGLTVVFCYEAGKTTHAATGYGDSNA